MAELSAWVVMSSISTELWGLSQSFCGGYFVLAILLKPVAKVIILTHNNDDAIFFSTVS